MDGVTGMLAWLGHVPGRCRGRVYGHVDIDKPFFRIVYVAEMEVARARVQLARHEQAHACGRCKSRALLMSTLLMTFSYETSSSM